ncbi:hypothetical protein GCM10025867_21180 [Frondihabitans sucicola]|uniref:ABC transporter domain-containing protein n=1 Tax=Frondihabitans sucicola TaxID=1268041 RepID=A0ABM8GN54_9MICO|nr:hypothetical protein GCM10025867_21180 [Frondihabitans sucicola]
MTEAERTGGHEPTRVDQLGRPVGDDAEPTTATREEQLVAAQQGDDLSNTDGARASIDGPEAPDGAVTDRPAVGGQEPEGESSPSSTPPKASARSGTARAVTPKSATPKSAAAKAAAAKTTSSAKKTTPARSTAAKKPATTRSTTTARSNPARTTAAAKAAEETRADLAATDVETPVGETQAPPLSGDDAAATTPAPKTAATRKPPAPRRRTSPASATTTGAADTKGAGSRPASSRTPTTQPAARRTAAAKAAEATVPEPVEAEAPEAEAPEAEASVREVPEAKPEAHESEATEAPPGAELRDPSSEPAESSSEPAESSSGGDGTGAGTTARLSSWWKSARSKVQERLDEARASAAVSPPSTTRERVAGPASPVEPEPERAAQPEPEERSERAAQPEPAARPERAEQPEPPAEPEPPAQSEPAPQTPVRATAPKSEPTDSEVPADAPVVLSISGLVKRYGSTTAVENVNLDVRAGSFYGIVGPNGAGKTTTLSIATGLLRPDAGTVTILGTDVWSTKDAAKAKRSLGVLPDRLRLFDKLTGAQYLYYAGLLRGLDGATARKRSADLANAFGLHDALGRLVSDYSVGMTKKVALAAAIIHSPRVLVLDEPFESVDPVSAATVTEILQRYVRGGGTVLLSSHSMDLVERICDSVAVIVDGHVLAQGTVNEVRAGRSLQERFVELAGGGAATEGMEWLHTFSD